MNARAAIFLVLAAGAVSAAAAAAPAAAQSGTAGSASSDAGPEARYGTSAIGMPFDRELRLGPRTRSIGVWRFETVNFVAADGRQFRWRFDTARELDAFPLERIAPAGVGVPSGVTVYVNGEIPIAP
jgi:hypothetical protein